MRIKCEKSNYYRKYLKYSETCLNRISLGPAFVARNRQVFDFYRYNEQRFPKLGLYLNS